MLTYTKSILPKSLRAFYGFTLIFLVAFTAQKANANETGFALHFGTYAYYSYNHPNQIDLNVNYLVDIFLDNEQAEIEDLNYVDAIEFEIFFKVDGDHYHWDLDRVNLYPGYHYFEDFATITTSYWFDGTEWFEGYHFFIHDPVGFFGEVRLWSETSSSGTPVAVVEALPSVNIVLGACGTEDIHYNECRTVTPFVPTARVIFYNGNSIDIGTSLPSSTPCYLDVYFPCDVYPGNDLPFGEDDHLKNGRMEAPSMSVEVFPNPTSDELYVQFNHGSKGTVQLELFNASGQQVFASERQAKQVNQPVDLRQYPPGFYLLRINDFATGQTYSKKVLIQR